MSWWNLSPCSSLTSPQFSGKLSKWPWGKCIFLAVSSWLLFCSQRNSESLIWKMPKIFVQHHSLIQWNAYPLQFFNVWKIKNSVLLFLYTNASKSITQVLKTLAFFIEYQTVSLTPVWYKEEILFCLLELEDYKSHFYHQASILFSRISLCWHNVDPWLYCPINIESMEYFCIQIADPVENLLFSSLHRSTNYNLRIWSVPSIVLLAHTFLVQLLNAQFVWKYICWCCAKESISS